MNERVTRRAAIGIGVAAATGLVAWRIVGEVQAPGPSSGSSPGDGSSGAAVAVDDDATLTQDVLARRLSAKFAGLALTPGATAAFAAAYVEQHGEQAAGAFDAAADRFLRSTDLFANGVDSDEPVDFITLYDPYASPCFNPVARLVG